MKFYKILTLAFAALLAVSFTSCEKDDNDDNKESFLPVKITIDNSKVYSFSYDQTGEDPKRITNIFIGERNSAIAYDEKGRVKQFDSFNDYLFYTKTYAYKKLPSNKTEITIKTVCHFTENIGCIGPSEDIVVILDRSGRIISALNPMYYSGDIESQCKYSGNNVVEIKTKELPMWEGHTLNLRNTSTNRSYNKGKGIFRDVTTPKWFLEVELEYLTPEISGQTANNIAKQTLAIDGKHVYTIDFLYSEFTPEGYPARMHAKPFNSSVIDHYTIDYKSVK